MGQLLPVTLKQLKKVVYFTEHTGDIQTRYNIGHSWLRLNGFKSSRAPFFHRKHSAVSRQPSAIPVAWP
ncbi:MULTISPECIES: hypothetical protein [Moorena]|uniref:hypothetical protein n=1 Tax=Moorena TaxID=1155738 RepID=UPI0002FC3E68|nr:MULTISPECIES: hypothetical protein [Moorena]NEP34802.1 hypothetical protein [Moorena sp. SIO3B2]NEP64579.1 hypothetical protein [Moorena sp. SIO3A5]NET64084.1 hypothetical protein [Moorena sp. SIO1G6]